METSLSFFQLLQSFEIKKTAYGYTGRVVIVMLMSISTFLLHEMHSYTTHTHTETQAYIYTHIYIYTHTSVHNHNSLKITYQYCFNKIHLSQKSLKSSTQIIIAIQRTLLPYGEE